MLVYVQEVLTHFISKFLYEWVKTSWTYIQRKSEKKLHKIKRQFSIHLLYVMVNIVYI